MFGLFRTEKNPKGPDIKRLQHLDFDLVDSRLSFSLPYSNSTFVDRNHKVKQLINIYDHKSYNSLEINKLYSIQKLVEKRAYEYSRFNHRGYGMFSFNLNLFRHNQVDNLFDDSLLMEVVSSYVLKENNEWNTKEYIDEDCKLSITQKFQFCSVGGEKYLSYGVAQLYDKVPDLSYIMAISPHHYISFNFSYTSVRNTEDVWYQMAKAIEHQILSSVKLELNDELQAEKDSANKG